VLRNERQDAKGGKMILFAAFRVGHLGRSQNNLIAT